MKKSIKFFSFLLMFFTMGICLSSCGSDDDEPTGGNLVGKWVYTETYSEDEGAGTIEMILTFNSNNTGSIVERWQYQSKASSNETYSMEFSWSTTTDTNGNDILRISYVSGDRETELFPGYSNTVLWTRQYVLTGKILNIYGGSGVWVFNKK